MEGTNQEPATQSSPTQSRKNERDIRFEVVPKTVDVRTASGDVRLLESSDETCTVHLSTNDPDPVSRLAKVECSYDSSSKHLVIDTNVKSASNDGLKNLKSTFSKWFDGMRHDVDIEIYLPRGPQVRFRTASGDLFTTLSLSGLDVASASGSVSVKDVAGPLKVNSASGDLIAGDVRGSVDAKSASGDVHLGNVEGDLKVQVVSGDVTLSLSEPVDAKVNTVSGDIVIALRSGLLLNLDASTVSGDLSSEIPLDGGGANGSEPNLHLKVRTVSGDLVVRRT